MVLDGEDRVLRRAGAFHGLVVQVDVRNLGVGGEVFPIGGEAVVLGRDFDLASAQVLHGLVAATVTEL